MRNLFKSLSIVCGVLFSSSLFENENSSDSRGPLSCLLASDICEVNCGGTFDVRDCSGLDCFYICFDPGECSGGTYSGHCKP
jgi:hypothetical protein